MVRLGDALAVFASLEEVEPLRAAAIGASVDNPDLRWSDSELYRTLESRLVDVGVVEAQLERAAAAESERRRAVWGHVAASLRALAGGDPAKASEALAEAGEVEEGAGRLEAAERLYERALELGRKPRDRRGEGVALRRLARVAKSRGDLGRALRHYRAGYEVSSAARDVHGAIVACQGLGNTCVDQGDWAAAERWYERGLELVSEGPSAERWQLESNLSIVARRSGRLEESEGWLRRGRATASAIDDPAAAIYLDNAEGMLRMAQGRPADAERSYGSALAASPAPPARAAVLINLAECLLEQGRAAESVAVVRELERLAIAENLQTALPHVYLALGEAARVTRDPEALVFYEQALDLARAGGNDADTAQVHRAYAKWEREQGAIESAAARLMEAVALFERSGSHLDAEEARRALDSITRRGPGSPPAS